MTRLIVSKYFSMLFEFLQNELEEIDDLLARIEIMQSRRLTRFFCKETP